jgi:hypothetical protein
MAQKQTIKEISAQLRDPQHIDILRMLLKRYGKRLQVARLTVKDGYLHYAGTTGNMISYWWRGVNCLRTKGTLNRKSFFKKKCFEGSRKSAKRFALGNELASRLYARVMVSRKTYPLFCFLKKKAILLIKEGKTIVEAEEILIDYLQSFGLVKRERKAKCEERRKMPSNPITIFNCYFKPVIPNSDRANVRVETVNCELIPDDS